jgi:hypothetical protein
MDGRPLSDGLRERVIAAIEKGLSCRQAASLLARRRASPLVGRSAY